MVVGLAMAAGLVVLPASVGARESSVRIGTVTLHQVELDEGTVRTALGEEADLAVSARPTKKHVVLAVSVAKRSHDEGIEYVVSAVVGDAHGSMIGMVEGHAHASGQKVVGLDRQVLKLAAHGAMAQLPAMMR